MLLKNVKNRKAQALVEFGLVLPILVMVMVAILEMGFMVRDYITINYILSQAVKEASLMRGVTDGDIHVMKKILESSYGLDPSRLKVISSSGKSYGPYKLTGDSIYTQSGSEVTGFSEPLFFYSDSGTPNDPSDDVPTTSKNSNASYAIITISYTHKNLAPYPEFMSMDNLVITESKTARLE